MFCEVNHNIFITDRKLYIFIIFYLKLERFGYTTIPLSTLLFAIKDDY